ncbi:MAG: 3'-5' exonuclease [Lachnospiraceae bacterium]|nr:3'-5' exonuclease [Lachnospiraceae bacterium]
MNKKSTLIYQDDGVTPLLPGKHRKQCPLPSKGKSLPEAGPDYTVLDLETTGLQKKRHEIIEITALRVRGNVITDVFTTLVKPVNPPEAFITDLTGITGRMLSGAPPLEKVLPSFLDFLGDDLLMGYNIPFDLGFLNAECITFCDRLITNDYVDVMRVAKRCLPELQHHRLTDVASCLGLSTAGAHRAESDCRMTHLCYQKLKDKTA